MTMRPFRETKAGGSLSSSEINRAFTQIERSTRLTAAAPLILTPDWQGQKISIVLRKGWYVRITAGGSGSGSGAGSGSGSVPGYYYSGIEQKSVIGQGISDNIAGQSFNSRTFPLVEMSENESVPEDAIVWAQLAATMDHAEFLWDSGGGSTPCPSHPPSGSGCNSGTYGRCCIRISEFFQRVGDDCQYRDGCLCLTANGLEFIPDA